MSTPEVSGGEQKYYEPAEVEAYVNDVTNVIKGLQASLREATVRAEAAERALADNHPETATLGRALLLAGEVADKTVAEADIKAEEIVRAAQDRASGITGAARSEAQRLVTTAREASADLYQMGEARLLAAVDAFIQGAEVLRGELATIKVEASTWRDSIATSDASGMGSPSRAEFDPPPKADPNANGGHTPGSGSADRTQSTEPGASSAAPSSRSAQANYDAMWRPSRSVPELPGGIHNRARLNPDSEPPETYTDDQTASLLPPPPTTGGDGFRPGTAV
jgi:cell division septum initiation protein DivIVA